jgi:hypothetical protein
LDRLNGSIFGKLKTRRKKTLLLVSITVIAMAAILIFLGFSLYNPHSSENNVVNFVCYSSSSNSTTALPVEVDLADGMNQEGAIRVALQAFHQRVNVREGSVVRDFNTIANFADGIWTVKLEVTVFNGVIGASKSNFEGGVVTRTPVQLISLESFLATVDPNTQTIKFDLLLMPGD